MSEKCKDQPQSSSQPSPSQQQPTVSSWPLVVVIEDCYVPAWAREIVKTSRNTPVETNYAVIGALAVLAELGLKRERLN